MIILAATFMMVYFESYSYVFIRFFFSRFFLITDEFLFPHSFCFIISFFDLEYFFKFSYFVILMLMSNVGIIPKRRYSLFLNVHVHLIVIHLLMYPKCLLESPHDMLYSRWLSILLYLLGFWVFQFGYLWSWFHFSVFRPFWWCNFLFVCMLLSLKDFETNGLATVWMWVNFVGMISSSF